MGKSRCKCQSGHSGPNGPLLGLALALPFLALVFSDSPSGVRASGSSRRPRPDRVGAARTFEGKPMPLPYPSSPCAPLQGEGKGGTGSARCNPRPQSESENQSPRGRASPRARSARTPLAPTPRPAPALTPLPLGPLERRRRSPAPPLLRDRWRGRSTCTALAATAGKCRCEGRWWRASDRVQGQVQVDVQVHYRRCRLIEPFLGLALPLPLSPSPFSDSASEIRTIGSSRRPRPGRVRAARTV
jgi:hypothetical protein